MLQLYYNPPNPVDFPYPLCYDALVEQHRTPAKAGTDTGIG